VQSHGSQEPPESSESDTSAETVETIEDVGEFGLIRRVRARSPETGPAVLLGSGDDAAVLATPDGRVVASTDLLLEGRHFRRDWSSAYDVGRKAAAQNFADIAAMGAVPTSLLVALVLPGDLPVAWVEELADGFNAECAVAGAVVAGGDMVRGDVITISVTALGDLEGRAPVCRDGAQPGDVLAIAGRLGWSAAGLELLLSGAPVDPDGPGAGYLAAHRRPTPPYAAGPAASALGATSMLDVSDGLLADLGHLAEASKVHIDVRTVSLGASDDLRLEWILTGGEDHALAATFPPDVPLPPEWRVIGVVREGSPSVTVDGASWSGPAGFTHFGG
jgi:thiamine-monophosphate kinase